MNLERTKQELDQWLYPMEKEFKDCMNEFRSMKYEIDSKIAEWVNQVSYSKSDSVSEILKLKNDLYGFVDSKLTHIQTVLDKRIDAIHSFANENDIRIKRLSSYKDEIEI